MGTDIQYMAAEVDLWPAPDPEPGFPDAGGGEIGLRRSHSVPPPAFAGTTEARSNDESRGE